jgi:transposase
MKDHLLVDRRGVPLSALVTRANVNDAPMLEALIQNLVVVRPLVTRQAPQHLALDAAFDDAKTRAMVFAQHYTAHIAPKGGRDENAPRHPGAKARRSRRGTDTRLARSLPSPHGQLGEDDRQSVCLPLTRVRAHRVSLHLMFADTL